LAIGVSISVEEELTHIPSYSQELKLDPTRQEDRFRWFLASILFAKRISTEVAKRTYQRFVEEGLDTPERILTAGWDRLVEVLDSGGYVRYDFSTATALLEIMRTLIDTYGDLEVMHSVSASTEDLERRLKAMKGIGPVGVNIFLRELRDVWEKADPDPSPTAITVAQRLGMEDVKRHESAFVRIHLEYCKKRKCDECPVEPYCQRKIVRYT
jgi:endonuclease III